MLINGRVFNIGFLVSVFVLIVSSFYSIYCVFIYGIRHEDHICAIDKCIKRLFLNHGFTSLENQMGW